MEYLEAAYHAFVALGGGFALVFAFKRIKIAERNLKQERFKTAGELLALKGHAYASRVAGAVMMAEIARDDPENYEKPVMRAFEAFLEHPPRYASVSIYPDREEPESKMIDYESRDTVTIIEAIRERTSAQRREYKTIELSENAPFILWKDRYIYCNAENCSYNQWRSQHGGRCPSYECLAKEKGAPVGKGSAWYPP